MEIHCDVVGWEFESSVIGDTLGADCALGPVGIDGNGAEELIFRLVWKVFILSMPKMTFGMNISDNRKSVHFGSVLIPRFQSKVRHPALNPVRA